jgi:hypothetical protein
MAKVKVYQVEGVGALEAVIQQAIDNNIHVLPYTQNGDNYTIVTVANEPQGQAIGFKENN